MLERKSVINTAESWKKLVLSFDASISDAINILNETGLKIVLVVSNDGFLEGIISDGDIRRGLLRGINISDSIKEVIHSDPLTVPISMKKEIVINLMVTNKIQQIPIVGDGNLLVGIHSWNDLYVESPHSNIIVIMAGGMGTRLSPETQNRPKPLLEISGKPILEHIIENAKADGFTNFIIAIYHLGHMIENYFGDGSKFGVNIKYFKEPNPLGTAGALSLFDSIPDKPFIVTNGDIITDTKYSKLLDFHIQNNAVATMGINFHELKNPFGIVYTDGIDIVGYEEKPTSLSRINAGVYVLNPTCVNFLPKNSRIDMPDLFESLIKNNEKVIAFPIHEYWMDIGRPADLKSIRDNL